MNLGGISIEQSTAYKPVSPLAAMGREPEGESNAFSAASGSVPETLKNSSHSSNPKGLGLQSYRNNSEEKNPNMVADTVDLSTNPPGTKRKSRNADAAQVEAQHKTPLPKSGDVLFVYNFRGDLRVKFMDSSNRLIYQNPSLMVSRIMDIMGSKALRVNMKV